jgi:membrane-anchored protein YejM (alkaline phosphatase superfamily)
MTRAGGTRLNVVLLVVDSLRARSLHAGPEGPKTPFLADLRRRTIDFRRAYATECWTLPTHASMFTGRLPSEHGAHFQTMGYAGTFPTLAELLAEAGYHTEVVTRNSIFDGSMPGITRGFATNTQPLSQLSGLNPLAIMLALSKPRFKRQIAESGFFHPLQRQSREFVTTFARATVPADQLVLEHALHQMSSLRRRGQPYFLFCNLYDVHAPYPPVSHSIFRPFRSLDACVENLFMPFVLPCLGGHAYLRPGFRLSATSRRLLLGRYHSAIELMDAKLAAFHAAAEGAGLLDDTLLIVTSDHGEAFGEHGLYLHDASVYDTHLHVPLYVHHPERAPAPVDDVVSTRDLFGLLRAVAMGAGTGGTLLDPAHRAERPIALAEHFHYPHARGADPRYRRDLLAAVAGERKAIVSADGIAAYDLVRDPDETSPEPTTLHDFAALCRRDGLPDAAVDEAMAHLGRWSHAPARAPAARPAPSSDGDTAVAAW